MSANLNLSYNENNKKKQKKFKLNFQTIAVIFICFHQNYLNCT